MTIGDGRNPSMMHQLIQALMYIIYIYENSYLRSLVDSIDEDLLLLVNVR